MSLPAFPDSVPLTAFRLPRNSKRYTEYTVHGIKIFIVYHCLSHCHINLWESYFWCTVLAFISCVFASTLDILHSSFCFEGLVLLTRDSVFGSISGCG